MIDCEDSIECFYDVIAEASDCSKIKELVLKMGVKTVGDLCKIPVARFDSPHRLDVDSIKKAVDQLLSKKSAEKSGSASVPQTSQSKNDDATVPLMTEDIEVETPTPIKSCEDSESTNGIKSQDSCPNGQIIKGTFPVISLLICLIPVLIFQVIVLKFL